MVRSAVRNLRRASLALLLAMPQLARAQAAPPGPLVRVHLADGGVVTGRMVQETDAYVVVVSESLGETRILRTRIERLEFLEERRGTAAAWRTDPDLNSLVFVPTSETLPRRSTYYRNFELLFNNVGFAPTDDLNLSVMLLFPVASGATLFGGGFKYRLLSREKAPVGLAAAGSFTVVGSEHLEVLSGIASLGDARRGLSLAANYAFAGGDNESFFLIGGDVQVGPGVKLVAEYGTSGSALLEDEDFHGAIDIGVRVFWNRVSFTMTGFRPLGLESNGFFAFPVAVFSAHY